MTDKTALTDAERSAIEEKIKALHSESLAAAEKVDVDRMFASSSSAYEIGNINNGVFIPSLDALVAGFRELFATALGQDINVAETRVAVLGPNAAVLTAHGDFIATSKDGTMFESPFAHTMVFAKIEDDWRIIHSHQSFPHQT